MWVVAGARRLGLPLMLTPSLPAVLAGMVLVAVGTFFAQATATGFVGRAATADRGAASGIYLACYFSGGLVGSAVLGQFFDMFGWHACVAGIALSLAVAVTLTFWLIIDLERAKARRPPDDRHAALPRRGELRHAAPARGKPMDLQTPVAIVGGGPVGLVLALLLDFYGVKSHDLQHRDRTSAGIPRATARTPAPWSIYRQLGFSDEVRQLGLPGDHPFDQAYFTRLSTHEIYRFPDAEPATSASPCAAQMPVTDQLPEPMFHVNQMYVERFLLRARARAAECRRALRLGGRLVHPGRERRCGVHARKTDGSDGGDLDRALRRRLRRRARLHPQDARHRLRGRRAEEGRLLGRAVLLDPHAHPRPLSEIRRPSARLDVLGGQSRPAHPRRHHRAQRRRRVHDAGQAEGRPHRRRHRRSRALGAALDRRRHRRSHDPGLLIPGAPARRWSPSATRPAAS